MTQHTEPKAPTTRRGKGSFASPGMIRLLAGAVLAIGVVAGVAGMAYAINGATQARAYVTVGVHARNGAVLEAVGTTPAGAQGTVLVKTEPFESGVLRLNLHGAPTGNWLEAHTDALTLRSWDSTVPEQLLNRGGFAVVGLCIGVGAVWLRRLLISIADGRPFQPGNAARIAGIGGLVVIASLANDILPVIGSNLVLQRLGLTGASSPIFAQVIPSLGPLLAMPLLLALAEAFRRGAELAKDVEGLV